MSERDGADTLKRIGALEEQLDKRFDAVRKKAKELISQSRAEASRIVDRKNEELAKVRDMALDVGEADDVGNKTDTQTTGITPEQKIDPKIVSRLAESLFQLLIERKRM